MTNIIDFENVSLRYNDAEIIKNISFSINEGENCVILGPNGSGKSTLIKLISSEIYPSISEKPSRRMILGQSAWNVAKLRTHLGIITNDLHNKFANDGYNITGLEAVISGFFGTLGLFPYQEIKDEFIETAKASLERLGISYLAEVKLGTMSTGELRKCLVARALVHPLKAILLDEPTVGLDIKAQASFIKMMRSLAQTGTTIILVTHHIEEVFEEISKVILLKDGQIFAQGKKDEIISQNNLSELFEIGLELHKNGEKYSIIAEG